ncbi:MAG: mitochondrial fission ELM1 family protein [Gammaproteobacteria bacterium]|nr:mitochondrial fission ELM1 family protein [Gammaproteobacteria bacterium]
MTVWHFPDGTAGHERQVSALIDALALVRPLDPHAVPLLGPWQVLRQFAGARTAPFAALPTPDLLIVAGRRTHWSGLAARRARGGRLVVLMRPGLPLTWFDLCLVPRHDNVPPSQHVMVTTGALARPRPASAIPRENAGLILVGGPSRHFSWDETALLHQVHAILEDDQKRAFTIADSRRTPDSTSRALERLARAHATFVSHRGSAPGWLDQQYDRCDAVWVTRDSVSMVFEALSSGAAVGLLDVPGRRPAGRMLRATEELVATGSMVTFAAWRSGSPLRPPPHPLREAERCATEIISRWFPSDTAAYFKPRVAS